MNMKEKLLVVVLGILILVAIGGVACTYYSTYTIDLIWVAVLGILVFVLVGVVACSYSRDKIAKRNSN
jgi:hypothetical protein